MAIKCTCGDPNCVTEIDFSDNMILITGHPSHGSLVGIYLDANAIAEMIRRLKSELLRRAGFEYGS